MKIAIQVVFYGWLILNCSASSSMAYADVLFLKNGDRITGEIKRIWDAEISIEPAYSDEFEVDLAVVDYIESDRVFEIDLDDGRSFLASFAGTDPQGNQLVESGDETLSVPLENLFELDEPEVEFEWDSHVEVSFDIKKGNTDTANSKVRADSTAKFGDHRHLGEITFFREELASVVTKEQDLFKYGYNWFFKDPWFIGANLTFERDPIIELDSRVIISAGIGRDIWSTPRRALSVQLGGGFQQEVISSNTTDSTVATWTLRYRQDFLNEDMDLFHNHTITSNITGRTNTSYKTTTGISYEITDLLTSSISLDFNYETDPVDFAQNEDIALLFGLGLEFE